VSGVANGQTHDVAAAFDEQVACRSGARLRSVTVARIAVMATLAALRNASALAQAVLAAQPS